MEFKYDLSQIASTFIIKIDNSLLPIGYQHDNPELQMIIANIVDKIGQASAVAQDLKSPITSADKLKHSDHILYLMTEQKSPLDFAVVGLLKIGWKKLYLFNKKGSRTEETVYCLLDFYIHETSQRDGYGIKLMEYMLNDNKIQAKQLAVDRPSNKLMQFLWKHFNLSKLVNQGNNYVIYEDFFENCDLVEKQSDGHDRSSGYKSQPTYGRFGASRRRTCIGNILFGARGQKTKNYIEQENGDVHQEMNQQRNDHGIQIQKHKEAQKHHEDFQQQNSHHVSDKSNGRNHITQKSNIKNVHTQLW